jgi:hypothetical protein
MQTIISSAGTLLSVKIGDKILSIILPSVRILFVKGDKKPYII